MKMSDVKITKATERDYDELLDFLNMVFGFNGQENDFLKLLPKLYREQYEPWKSNYIAKDENGRMVCAVGAYDEEYSVAGETIRFRGVGNVAAHPRAKGKGYMRAAMDAAMADMVKDGVDFSALGGLGQTDEGAGQFILEPGVAGGLAAHTLLACAAAAAGGLLTLEAKHILVHHTWVPPD